MGSQNTLIKRYTDTQNSVVGTSALTPATSVYEVSELICHTMAVSCSQGLVGSNQVELLVWTERVT